MKSIYVRNFQCQDCDVRRARLRRRRATGARTSRMRSTPERQSSKPVSDRMLLCVPAAPSTSVDAIRNITDQGQCDRIVPPWRCRRGTPGFCPTRRRHACASMGKEGIGLAVADEEAGGDIVKSRAKHLMWRRVRAPAETDLPVGLELGQAWPTSRKCGAQCHRRVCAHPRPRRSSSCLPVSFFSLGYPHRARGRRLVDTRSYSR